MDGTELLQPPADSQPVREMPSLTQISMRTDTTQTLHVTVHWESSHRDVHGPCIQSGHSDFSYNVGEICPGVI